MENVEIMVTRGLCYTDANSLNQDHWEIIKVETIGTIGYQITWRKK